jgi:hypothetical protein
MPTMLIRKDQRRGRAGQGDHDPGREEQVERRRHLGQARHDHAKQTELAALQFVCGLFGDGHR